MRALLFGVVSLLGSVVLSGCGGSFKGTILTPGGTPQPQSGEPVVTGLSPASVAAGGPSFTITVTGKNFAQGDTVNWDEFPLKSTFVSSKEMTAVVPNDLIYRPGSATIVVQPPTPFSLAFGTTITVTNPPLPGTAGFTLSTVSVQANDLVWDAGSQQIFLSVAGSDPSNPNTITALNPVTGQIGASASAGPGAHRLGVSSDSRWLYAGIDANGTVQRYTLPGLASDITIPLGSDSAGRPFYAADFEMAHGSPDTIAISRATTAPLAAESDVAIYDGLTPRSSTASNFYGTPIAIGSLAWNASDSNIYASFNSYSQDYLFVLSVNSAGVQVAQGDNLSTSSEGITLGSLHYSALTGYVYSDEGQVFDPSSNAVVNHLPENALEGGFSSTPPLTIDDHLGMAWIVGQPVGDPNRKYVIEAFDLRTCALLGSIDLDNVAGTPVKLIRWGSNGLAFLTGGTNGPEQGDALYIISGDFVTTPSVQIRSSAGH